MALSNWSGNITFSTDVVHRPRTLEQVQELVSHSRRLRVLGSGHSFNRIADTDGDLMTLAELDTGPGVDIEIDEATRTVAVGAGVTYGTLTAVLQDRGWALHNLGSLPHITVAGACSTGTHGSGDANGCLATAALAVQFVRADGELVHSTRDDETFAGAVLSLGALGVHTRLWLALEPTYDLRQDVWLDASLDQVLAELDDVMSAAYSVSLFTRWSRSNSIDQIWLKARADAPEIDAARWGAHRAEVMHHPIAGVDAETCTPQLGVAGPWNTRLPHFRFEETPSAGDEQQSEFFVAREHAPAALEAIRALDLTPALLVSEVRTIAADALWLSPFHDRASVALHFTWVNDDEQVARAVDLLQRALADFDARPHWAKVFRAAPDVVRGHYPALDRFRELIERNDPNRCFGNDFLESYVY